jgi:beta-N-acetylhexosaminidase
VTRRRTRAAAVVGLGLVVSSCSGVADTDPTLDDAPAPVAPTTTSVPPVSSPAITPSSSPATTPSQSRSSGRRTTGPVSTWGPTPRELRRARRITARLPLSRLAGQVIVAEYDGRQPPTSLVNDLHLGGVIVMADNIGTTAGLRRSNRALRAAAREAGRRWPVFIGVDQEGGIVERVKGRATRFPTFMSAGAARDTGLTRRAAAAAGAELRDLGFSVVFAPSGDVTSGPQDPTIGSRSAGSGPRLVARQMNAAVQGYLSAGILPVVKHFPGHGSVPADSHVELPVQDRTLQQLRESDLVPFRAGVARGVPAVMVGHIDVRTLDPGVPATLSDSVVRRLLRRDLGFRGLAVTDAMNMAAVAERYSSDEAAVRALLAGNDVVLMPPSPVVARDGIVAAVRAGRLPRARLEQAAARQIAVLLHQRDLDPAVTRRPGTSRRASYRLSAGAATVASGPCRGRLLGDAVRASGPGDAVARFNAAARQAGLHTGSGTSVALVGYGGQGTSADVVVALDTPYALGRSSAGVAKIAMYGDTPGAMRALVRVLLGEARATGRLPVPVPNVRRRGC